MRATRGPTVAWLSFTHLFLTWMFLSNYCSLIFLHCGNVVSPYWPRKTTSILFPAKLCRRTSAEPQLTANGAVQAKRGRSSSQLGSSDTPVLLGRTNWGWGGGASPAAWFWGPDGKESTTGDVAGQQNLFGMGARQHGCTTTAVDAVRLKQVMNSFFYVLARICDTRH